MIVRWLTALGLAASCTVVLVGPASAGGGCHEGVTTGAGDTVEMIDACFTPTSLHVRPGTTVTWLNKDKMIHNITANGWGYFDEMHANDVARATFDDPGIYPYACAYHPGMSGAIVVGDGKGSGNGATVTVEAWEPPSDDGAPGAEVVSAAVRTGGGTSALPWVGGALIGFVLAVAGGAASAARGRGGATTHDR